MPSIKNIIAQTFKDIWNSRRSLLSVILIVMVPVVLLSVFTSNDQAIGAYGSFATLIMNMAVLSTVIRIKTTGQTVSVGQAYYEGTARLVAFIGVIVLLGLALVPFLIGGLFYLSGSTGSTVGLGTPELIILAAWWAIWSMPSIWLINRSIFALYFVLDSAYKPLAALRHSASLVRGHSWAVLGRLLVGTVVLFIAIVLPSLALSALPDSASFGVKLGTAALQIVSSVVLVSFASIYGYNIVEALGGKPRAS